MNWTTMFPLSCVQPNRAGAVYPWRPSRSYILLNPEHYFRTSLENPQGARAARTLAPELPDESLLLLAHDWSLGSWSCRVGFWDRA